MVNNGKNDHPDGMKGPKNVKTKASECQSDICRLNFVIRWDTNRFYIYLFKSSGDGTHQYHPYFIEKAVISFPTRLLTNEQIENTTEVIKAAASEAVGCKFLCGKFGKFINSIKINYLALKANIGKDSKLGNTPHMLEDLKIRMK